MKTLAFSLVLAALLGGCGSDSFDDDCSGPINDLKRDLGEPEDRFTARSGDYHSETYWYYSRGIARTFTWEDGTYGSCETSDFTFTPI